MGSSSSLHHFHFQVRKVMSDEMVTMSKENHSSSIVNAGSFMLSPYHAHSRLNPKTTIILPLIFISLFLLALLLINIKRFYNYHHPSYTPTTPTTPTIPTTTTNATPYTTIMLDYGELSYTSPTTSTTTTSSSSNSPSTNTNTTTTTSSDGEQLGLDKRVLDGLPRVLFGSIKTSLPSYPNDKKQSECAICLEEFGEKEILHLLPPCGHLFHSQCIHMWLHAHTNCPLCRYSLLLYDKLYIDTQSQGEIAIAMQAQPPCCTQSTIPNQEINPTMEVSRQAIARLNYSYNEGESSTMKPLMRRAKLERWHSTGRSLGGGNFGYCIKSKELDPPNSSPLLSLVMGDFHRSKSSISLSIEDTNDKFSLSLS